MGTYHLQKFVGCTAEFVYGLSVFPFESINVLGAMQMEGVGSSASSAKAIYRYCLDRVFAVSTIKVSIYANFDP